MARAKKGKGKGKTVKVKKNRKPNAKGQKAQQAREPEGKKAGAPKGSSSKDSQSLVRTIKKMIRITNAGRGEVDTLKKKAESLIRRLKRKSSRTKYGKMIESIMGMRTARSQAGGVTSAVRRPKDLTYKGVVKDAGGKTRSRSNKRRSNKSGGTARVKRKK